MQRVSLFLIVALIAATLFAGSLPPPPIRAMYTATYSAARINGQTDVTAIVITDVSSGSRYFHAKWYADDWSSWAGGIEWYKRNLPTGRLVLRGCVYFQQCQPSVLRISTCRAA